MTKVFAEQSLASPGSPNNISKKGVVEECITMEMFYSIKSFLCV